MLCDPKDILFWNEFGNANLDKTLDPWRVLGRHVQWFPVFFRMHFINQGSVIATPTADLTIGITAEPGLNSATPLDTRLKTEPSVGLNSDLNRCLGEWEVRHWVLRPGCGLRFQWTHPDTGLIGWGIEVGWYYDRGRVL